MAKNKDLEQAVRRVLKGDRNAFSVIIQACEQDLWQTVTYFLGNRRLVEDVVQRTFVKAYENLETYREGRSFGAWIKGIARNEVKMEFRRLAREHRAAGDTLEYLATHALMSGARDESIQERKIYLRECMDRLPEHIADLLNLRYEEEASVKTIADQAKKSSHTIFVALSRARAALRDCIRKKEARLEV